MSDTCPYCGETETETVDYYGTNTEACAECGTLL